MASLLTTHAITLAFKIIKSSTLSVDVPKIFKRNKPKNFSGECIVITSLPMTGDQMQKCIVIINVIVPNLDLLGNGTDLTQPDETRLQTLGAKVYDLFKDYDQGDNSFRVESENIFKEDGFDEHYLSFRVVFRNINI